MRRDPLDIVHDLADTLRKTPSGEMLRVNDVATGAEIHWSTAARYLGLVQFIQRSLPTVSLIEVGGTTFAKIVHNPWLDAMTPEDRLLSVFFEGQALSIGKAMEIPKSLAESVPKLLERGMLKVSEKGRAYLLPPGMDRALKQLSPAVRMFDRSFSDAVVGENQAKPMGAPISDLMGVPEAVVERLETLLRHFEQVQVHRVLFDPPDRVPNSRPAEVLYPAPKPPLRLQSATTSA